MGGTQLSPLDAMFCCGGVKDGQSPARKRAPSVSQPVMSSAQKEKLRRRSSQAQNIAGVTSQPNSHISEQRRESVPGGNNNAFGDQNKAFGGDDDSGDDDAFAAFGLGEEEK